MTPLRQLPRLLRIAATLVRYRLDDLVEQAHLFRPLRWLRPFLPRPRADIAHLPRGARLRLALIELGPIFVKFGQILSTRRDLLPADVADELSQLQDRVPPFPGAQARAAIEARSAHRSRRCSSPSTERRWRRRRSRRCTRRGCSLTRPVPVLRTTFHRKRRKEVRDSLQPPTRGKSSSRCCGRASPSASAPMSNCCARSASSPSAGIRPPTRSGRAKSSPRSRRRCTTNSTCSAKARTPACCGAISPTKPISSCPRCSGRTATSRC